MNAIAPGQILESLPAIAKIDPTFGDRYTARAAAKRLITRAEIANVIALICTPPFDMMTRNDDPSRRWSGNTAILTAISCQKWRQANRPPHASPGG